MFFIGGFQEVCQINIKDNKLILVSNKVVSDFENDNVILIFDSGIMGIIVTTSRGIIRNLKF